MSLHYLAEHAENAKLALELAQKEIKHLTYTHKTLFAQPINLVWVQSLAEREDLSEKIDAFVSRFSRLQDHIGEKLIPRFAALLGESPKSLLDVLATNLRRDSFMVKPFVVSPSNHERLNHSPFDKLRANG